jgi:hypothetical protein
LKRLARTDQLGNRLATIVGHVHRARPPLPEDVVADLIDLLLAVGAPGQKLLQQFWRRPPATRDGEPEGGGSVSGETVAAVARALATVEGVTLGAYLSEQIRSARPSDRRAGMLAAHAAEEDGAVAALAEQLDSPHDEVRKSALLNIEYATPDAALRNRVYAVARNDEAEQVRNEAAFLLGVWRDARARPLLLAMIDHPDAEIAATAVSAIRFVANDLVAGRWPSCATIPTLTCGSTRSSSFSSAARII